MGVPPARPRAREGRRPVVGAAGVARVGYTARAARAVRRLVAGRTGGPTSPLTGRGRRLRARAALNTLLAHDDGLYVVTAAAVQEGDVVLDVHGWERVLIVDRIDDRAVWFEYDRPRAVSTVTPGRYAHVCAPVLVRRVEDVAPELVDGGRWRVP